MTPQSTLKPSCAWCGAVEGEPHHDRMVRREVVALAEYTGKLGPRTGNLCQSCHRGATELDATPTPPRQPTLYRVTWEIDIEANTPREAAAKALEIQRDRSSIATVFSVGDGSGDTTQFDLTEDPDACTCLEQSWYGPNHATGCPCTGARDICEDCGDGIGEMGGDGYLGKCPSCADACEAMEETAL